MKYIKLIICLFILLLIFTFIVFKFKTYKVWNISYENISISIITIFNGKTGQTINVTDSDKVKHISNNLGSINFSIDKINLFMGYNYKITVYDKQGRKIKTFIIISSDTLTYKGFVYKDKTESIDTEFISNLFKRE